MSNMHLQFLHFRSGDHKLLYDVHSFTLEIRIVNEGTLLSGNFWLCLKHWKFEICSYNLLLKSRNYSSLSRIYIYIHTHTLPKVFNLRKSHSKEIWLVGRVFANGPGDLDSIPGRVIPKTLKMVLDASFLNTQQYKVRAKGKVEQSKERSSALSYTSV